MGWTKEHQNEIDVTFYVDFYQIYLLWRVKDEGGLSGEFWHVICVNRVQLERDAQWNTFSY